MLNKYELEFLEGLINEFKDKLKDEALVELTNIYNKLSEARLKNAERINNHHKRNKELHSLNTMLSRYRKQGKEDKIKEIEERIRQVKELSVDV